MTGSEEDKRYDTFEEYNYNQDILDKSYKNILSEDFDKFSSCSENEEIKNDQKIIEDCITLKKYLLHFNSIESCNNKHCCAYVNYWLNKKAKTYNNAINSPLKIYNEFLKDDNEFTQKNLCISKINNLNSDEYKKVEKLYKIYEHYSNYKILKHMVQIACNRAKLCATEYNNILSKNTKIEDNKFCKVLEVFKKEFEKDVSPFKSQCTAEIPDLFSYQEECNNLQWKPNEADSSSRLQAGQMEMEDTTGESLNIQAPKTLSGREEHHIPPSSFGTTLPISLFSSGVGILLIFLSSYKFTPFGHWIKLRANRFKGMTKNFDEEYEMLQHTSEYDERNSEYEGYNIAYNSL
ncbi:PIR Superfamily Protein [Plasmodium ovale wallikeri]|uniref:PIR Superfamily Protein n=1 Tax=Plasmodium ovale wallikeri TaxID=864142 RepID=A0A1A8YJ34_PLAOA|nr:PIR Superfamily Protein [Plasmodium ovale wallikeri]SBT31544.1 PIR Superfamily Protein [Plasmodium ovale wallikeri]